MFVLKLLSRLPLRLLYALTDVLYLLVYRLWRFRKTLTLENLRRSFPARTEAEMKRRGSARIFALVADQTPPREEEKHWTRFLSQDTAFFVGADKIARIVRAPVFFVGIARTSRGHYEAALQLLAEPPYSGEGTDIIERYARAAEAHIAKYPAEWLWMYRKWKYKKPLYA